MQLVLYRVLNGEDVYLPGIESHQHAVEGCTLAASCGPGNQYYAVCLFNETVKDLQRIF
jgi:hypothetical protein